MTMTENYKHLYEQAKKMLAMYQDELVPGYRKKIEELEKQIATGDNGGTKLSPTADNMSAQENEQLHVMQEPVAVTLTRGDWCMIMECLKYRADYHHAKMLETLANCQDQKTAGRIARDHELTMEHAETLRKIVEGILYPTPEPEEAQDNAGD